MTRLLLVEDDIGIIRSLTDFLTGEGFTVDTARGQRDAIRVLERGAYDLLLLDVSLPDGSGYTVCMEAKRAANVPVIFLTASDDETSVVTGLEMGADDYIAKPFRPRELVSRIRSVLRRAGRSDSVLELGSLRVDVARAQVLRDGREIFLSALEYRLLLVFLKNPGAVLSRTKLLEEIWDVSGEFVNDNTLTVYIKRLRDKIEDDPRNPTIIKTVRGLGYRAGE